MYQVVSVYVMEHEASSSCNGGLTQMSAKSHTTYNTPVTTECINTSITYQTSGVKTTEKPQVKLKKERDN